VEVAMSLTRENGVKTFVSPKHDQGDNDKSVLLQNQPRPSVNTYVYYLAYLLITRGGDGITEGMGRVVGSEESGRGV
jgi:hypothetical protein